MRDNYEYIDPDYIYTDLTTGVLRNLPNITDPNDLLFFESTAVLKQSYALTSMKKILNFLISKSHSYNKIKTFNFEKNNLLTTHCVYNAIAMYYIKEVIYMARTIQVRVDEQLKDSADILFSSLGLDTSTAIRIFLVASIEAGGIPFAVAHGIDRDSVIREAISYRKSGGEFLTAEQSLANMQAAIKAGTEHGI